MRVHFVIATMGFGGAERSLADLVPALAERGVSPTVTCLKHTPDDGFARELLAEGHDVRVLRPGPSPVQVLALRAELRRNTPEIVHTTLVKSDVVGRLAAAGCGTSVVTSLVNATYEPEWYLDPAISRRKFRLIQAVDGWTARHLTHHFHAISKSVKVSAMRTLGISAERISVIERGRDPARLGEPSAARKTRARLKLGLDRDAEVVLTVGSQEHQKGQIYLIHAFEALARDQPRAMLLLAGRRGGASNDLEEARSTSTVRDRIKILGHRDDIPELLAAADVFAFPSLYEGLGGAVIEAMALGLPIVASDIPVLREVVRDGRTGVLVAPRSTTALTEAVRSLLADRARSAAFSLCARAEFLARFSLERSADAMIRLYRQVAR